MELQTGDYFGLDRHPVAFTETRVVSQFASFTTTVVRWVYWCSWASYLHWLL